MKNERGHLHGHPPKLKTQKMEVEEDDGGWKTSNSPPIHGHIKFSIQNYKNAILQLRITKMEPWAENAGPRTCKEITILKSHLGIQMSNSKNQ